MSESWPSRHEPPAPALPRVEELPIVAEGYDRQKVREAFDAFYRHAAQLDAALRTLEAVEAFQRSASELRGDLRAIRAAGFAAQTWQRPYAPEPRLRRPLLPEAFPRVAVEVVFLIAVAVALGVSGWGALPVIGVMALALAIVWVVEWLASRERPARPVVRRAAAQPAAPALEAPEPAEAPAAAGWAAYAERDDERADAMTIVEPLPGTDPAAELDAPEAEIAEEVVVEAVAEPAVEAEAQPLEPAETVSEAEPTEEEEPDLSEMADVQPAAIDEPEAEELEVEPEPVVAEVSEAEAEAPSSDEDEDDNKDALEVDTSEAVAGVEAEVATPSEEDEDVVEEPAPEAFQADAIPSDDETSEEPLVARPSFWQRMRGRGSEPEPILVEPPRSVGPDDEAYAAADEENAPGVLVDEVGVLEAGEDAEPPAQLDELGVVESTEIEAGGDEVEEPFVAESRDAASVRRSFWRRRRRPEPAAVSEESSEVPAPDIEPELVESEGAAIDPWEQGLELPVEPELEPIEAEGELEHRDEPAADAEEPAEHEPLVLAEDEPLVRSGTEIEEDSFEAESPPEDDEPLIVAEAGATNDGQDGDTDQAEPKELPIEVLAEQAAAALERSRARRRHLRRARRR